MLEDVNVLFCQLTQDFRSAPTNTIFDLWAGVIEAGRERKCDGKKDRQKRTVL